MRPKLVDYSYFKVNKPNITVKRQVIFERKIDYINIFFNMTISIMILIGIYILYTRWKNKEENQKKYESDILKLNRKVNLN